MLTAATVVVVIPAQIGVTEADKMLNPQLERCPLSGRAAIRTITGG
jgi:hypothetical protein